LKGRILYLDAGRGLAALTVLIHHIMVFEGSKIADVTNNRFNIVDILNAISQQNVLAVEFFFVISGFSIFLSLARIRAKGDEDVWRVYFWHRARRILPLFGLALAWSYLLTLSSANGLVNRSLFNLAGNLLFLQTDPTLKGAWFVPFAGDGPLWSLSYEVWYYIALPLVLWLATILPGRFRNTEIALPLITVASLISIVFNHVAPNPFALFATLWPLWLMGYIAARLLDRGASAIGRYAGVILVVWVLLNLLSRSISSDTLNMLAAGYGVAAAVVLATLSSFSQWVRAFFARRPTRQIKSGFAWVGSGSYSIYILHYPMLLVLAEKQASLGSVCALVAGLVLLAPGFEGLLQRAVKGRSSASKKPQLGPLCDGPFHDD
jgi:peptidoglycan/LPS O-acetylase OafA/YrhL